jgi:hypothetical protein
MQLELRDALKEVRRSCPSSSEKEKINFLTLVIKKVTERAGYGGTCL